MVFIAPAVLGHLGPLYPQIIASGIPAGLHEDGVHIAPHNPWFALHYATTGLNVLGQQINPGQQISRQQALHAYTRGSAWYLNREQDLGSIERGKLADLLVLDKDYFTVSDSAMRTIRPLMTIVDGQVGARHGRAQLNRKWPAPRSRCGGAARVLGTPLPPGLRGVMLPVSLPAGCAVRCSEAHSKRPRRLNGAGP